MSKLEYRCDAILKDPYFKGSICNKKAIYKVKLENEKDYIHLRCGTHSRKMDKIELYVKNKKYIIDKKQEKENEFDNDENNFNLDELLKYIESNQYKKDIPQEIQDLFNEIDKLNNNLEHILI